MSFNTPSGLRSKTVKGSFQTSNGVGSYNVSFPVSFASGIVPVVSINNKINSVYYLTAVSNTGFSITFDNAPALAVTIEYVAIG
jgi:hypothetical protein